METAAYLTTLEHSGRSLSTDARRAGLDAIVPSCPEWNVQRLVVHQGNVHRWATEIVRSSRPSPTSDAENEQLFARSDDQGVLEWYDEGLTRVLAALQAAPDDLDCWTFLSSPTPRTFWTRRQAHETSIHSADAALAAGRDPRFDSELAEDGLDEILVGFYGDSGRRLAGEPSFSLSLRASDADRSWTLSRGPDGVTVSDAFEGECRITGSASDLYLFAWNRLMMIDRLEIEGDAAALDAWRTSFRI